MSNQKRKFEKSVWRNKTIDISEGPLQHEKLERLETWISQCTSAHTKTLFVQLSISMPLLSKREHVKVLERFQELLFAELCNEITIRYAHTGILRHSLLSLFWDRKDDTTLDVYLCVNGSLWSNTFEPNAITGRSLAFLLELSWAYAFAKTFGMLERKKEWFSIKDHYLLNEHIHFALDFNALLLEMSLMAGYRKELRYLAPFASATSTTETIHFSK